MKEVVIEAGQVSKGTAPRRNVKRGLSIMDLILRIFGAVGTLGAAVAMGTNEQSLGFATQFVQFSAGYDDLPTFA